MVSFMLNFFSDFLRKQCLNPLFGDLFWYVARSIFIFPGKSRSVYNVEIRPTRWPGWISSLCRDDFCIGLLSPPPCGTVDLMRVSRESPVNVPTKSCVFAKLSQVRYVNTTSFWLLTLYSSLPSVYTLPSVGWCWSGMGTWGIWLRGGWVLGLHLVWICWDVLMWCAVTSRLVD